ncbi:LacI family DNA-binding transcriptional regulator [Microbacterium horticulturae]|uniref:LacI family DNA-binding transcriptional regulator n=1 Tax=Microbacterium horticulturae TaxID=3028316 RepID=A0ABY8BZL1_9MICO|nr:LacI family DNA-binding transcriptional regulator [Microbacterium sp. KACC 23027]WEG09395.1 LacI family DNA-binding transcriptional regulator [Microbacterium sp. KACC 23027]
MVTIADVARAAGVSISTVSYVMSGKRTISQETRDRVAEAIADLEYSPHASARSLASRSTNVIGLQAPLRAGVDVHVVMQIVAGIVTEARSLQYDILLLTSDDASGLSHAARASMVDALLVMDVESDDPRIKTLEGLDVPSVLIGLPAGADGLVCVDFDFEAAGRLAAHRLAELGHRRVALFGAPAEVLERHTSYADRLVRGFLSACDELALVGSVHACPTGAESTQVVDAVLAAEPSLSGILIHNEGALPHIAAHLASSAHELGVIALCPAEIAQTVSGLADSIAIPAEGIGAAAADALRGLLAGEQREKVVLLPPVLASAGA